jgi:CheY-like chemotaxis protein
MLESNSAPDKPGCHVLIVENSAELRRLMAMFLEDDGHTVVSCGTPEEAIALLQEETIDLVLTDTFGTNQRNALESASVVLRAAGRAPVGLCTGYRFTPDEVCRAGFSGLIAKPFEPDEFLAQVDELCAVAKAAA